MCGALWAQIDFMWNLISKRAGACCDNAVMGAQLEFIAPPILRVERWVYRKWGTCEFCPHDDAQLFTPITSPPLRVVVGPLFCTSCRDKFIARSTEFLAEPVDGWQHLMNKR